MIPNLIATPVPISKYRGKGVACRLRLRQTAEMIHTDVNPEAYFKVPKLWPHLTHNKCLGGARALHLHVGKI